MYLEKFKLDRKTALVTGAGQGIGLACAEALAEAGAKVVIADRDPKLADSGRASLKAKGLDAEIMIMDVTDSGRVTEVADELASRYGGIDILVNNAGIARSETPAELRSTSSLPKRSTVASTALRTCSACMRVACPALMMSRAARPCSPIACATCRAIVLICVVAWTIP